MTTIKSHGVVFYQLLEKVSEYFFFLVDVTKLLIELFTHQFYVFKLINYCSINMTKNTNSHIL